MKATRQYNIVLELSRCVLRPQDFKQETVYMFYCPNCGEYDYVMFEDLPGNGDQTQCSFCEKLIYIEEKT